MWYCTNNDHNQYRLELVIYAFELYNFSYTSPRTVSADVHCFTHQPKQYASISTTRMIERKITGMREGGWHRKSGWVTKKERKTTTTTTNWKRNKRQSNTRKRIKIMLTWNIQNAPETPNHCLDINIHMKCKRMWKIHLYILFIRCAFCSLSLSLAP